VPFKLPEKSATSVELGQRLRKVRVAPLVVEGANGVVLHPRALDGVTFNDAAFDIVGASPDAGPEVAITSKIEACTC
jgi:hypothetical protein